MPGGGSLTVAPNDATALVAWGQRGPAANPQQLNRYSYVLNNPLRYVDPLGHADGDPEQLAAIGKGPGGGTPPQGGSGGGVGGGQVDDEDDRKQAGPQGDGKGETRGGGNGSSQGPPTTLPNPSAEGAKQGATNAPVVPPHAQNVAITVTQNGGQAPPGYVGNKPFQNDGRGGGQVLPTTDASGKPITYREYDVHPYTPGVNRGPERIVVGSDGSVHYTSDHYKTFTKLQ